METGRFYGQKVTSYRFLRDAIDAVENIKGDADIVITGPSAGGEGSDVEQLDDENLGDKVLMPEEVAGEVDVIYEESDEDCPPNSSRKTQKSSLPKWKMSHISPRIDLHEDKRESAKQLLLGKSPSLAEASEWRIFVKVFQNMLINAINIAIVYCWRIYQLKRNCESRQKDFRRRLVAVNL